MTPITQTEFYDPTRPDHRGNCWQTAIASILDLPLEDVPHFVQDEVDHNMDSTWHWLTRTSDWLRECGLMLQPVYELDGAPGEYLLVSGKSPRGGGKIGHVVVYLNGVMAHDPHPDRTGLLTIDSCAWTIRPIDAATV